MLFKLGATMSGHRYSSELLNSLLGTPTHFRPISDILYLLEVRESLQFFVAQWLRYNFFLESFLFRLLVLLSLVRYRIQHKSFHLSYQFVVHFNIIISLNECLKFLIIMHFPPISFLNLLPAQPSPPPAMALFLSTQAQVLYS